MPPVQRRERTTEIARLLRCPACAGTLSLVAAAHACDSCGTHYPLTDSGQMDMRPRESLERSVSFLVTPDDPLWSAGAADEDDPGGAPPEVAAMLPRAPAPGAWALEIGCGNNSLRQAIETAGWRYIGVDYGAASADFLVDVHALPFGPGAFGMIVAKALLEHVRFPHLAAAEMARVLAPGGTIIGDVAFLQPFHDSYYHMTHAAVRDLLHTAGLRLTAYGNGRESVFTYLARNSYLPLPAAMIVAACVYPADLLYRGLTVLKKRLLRRAVDQRVFLAVGVTFSAVKPEPVASAARGGI